MSNPSYRVAHDVQVARFFLLVTGRSWQAGLPDNSWLGGGDIRSGGVWGGVGVAWLAGSLASLHAFLALLPEKVCPRSLHVQGD